MLRFFLLLCPLFFTTVSTVLSLPIVGSRGTIESVSVLLDHVVYVPLKSFADANGLIETWDSKTRIASVKSNNLKISFRSGSDYALVNLKIQKMPARAKMIQGRLYIPLQFGVEIFSSYKLSQEKKTNLIPKSTLQPKYTGKFSVLLDPGHGGNDVGAKGSGVHEKNINMDIAKRVRDKLTAEGVRVNMTRSKDYFVNLWQRGAMTKQMRPSLFVSIHTNAAKNKSVHGIEIFYHGASRADIKNPSYQFAKIVQHNMVKTLKCHSRGIKTARFVVLRTSVVPAVLIEVGFVTNPWEGKNIAWSAYREKIAKAIAQSILDYKVRYKLK